MTARTSRYTQKLLDLSGADFPQHAGPHGGKPEYYPCADAMPGLGVFGPREIAEKQRFRLEIDGKHAALRGIPRAGGDPMFMDPAFNSLKNWTRYLLVVDYLKLEDIILNRQGGLHILQGKSEQERHDRLAEAGKTLDGLFYHCPRQILTVLFLTLPGHLGGQVSKKDPIINPKDLSWRSTVLSWVRTHELTRPEVETWIHKVDGKMRASSRRGPKTAKDIADVLAGELGMPRTADGYRRPPGIPEFAIRKPR